MKKKRIIVVVLMLVAIFNTGCLCPLMNITDAIGDTFRNIGADVDQIKNDWDLDSTIDDLSSGSWSADTMAASEAYGLAVAEANDVLNRTESSYAGGVLGSVGRVLQGGRWFREDQLETDQAAARKTVDKAKLELDMAMAADKQRQAAEKKSQQEKEEGSVPWIIIIPVVIILIILLVMLWLRKKKAPKIEPIAATPAIETSQGESKQVSKLSVNHEEACRKICEKHGLNLAEEVAKTNGDYAALLNQFLMMGIM